MSRPFISWTLTLGFWWDHATNPQIISTKKTFAMQDPALGPQRQKHRKLWPFHFFFFWQRSSPTHQKDIFGGGQQILFSSNIECYVIVLKENKKGWAGGMASKLVRN